METDEEAQSPEEKQRKRREALEQLRREHLELGIYLKRIALEEFKKEAEKKQCTFAELIAEVRGQGEDVPPEVEKLLLDAEGKI
jgi:hypothetical protein